MVEQFHRPTTVREALALRRRFRDRAVFLAGGTYVNSSECAARPEHCISLEGLGLDRIESKPGQIVIGALCTLQRLIDDRRVPAALQAAARQVVSRNVRNMATLGGHVALNLAASDVLPMLVALDARILLSGAGAAKSVPVADHAAKPSPGLITRIVVPRPAPGRAAACRNVRVSANARSLVTAAVSMTLARAIVRDPIVAVGGVSRHVVRLAGVEEALDGGPLPAPDELQALVGRALRPAPSAGNGATIASAEFRRYQAGVVVALAFEDARRQKRGRG
jgi:putative selenate reductase FAD-binding subunit